VALQDDLGRAVAAQDHAVAPPAGELRGERGVRLDVRAGEDGPDRPGEGERLHLDAGVAPRGLSGVRAAR
jgi:hypothetical protein